MNIKMGEIFFLWLTCFAKYDTLLEKHLQSAQENPRSVSYLSPTIQNEFIHLLSAIVRSNLLADIRKAKYYRILVDSTSDLEHREQLSRVIRYVDVTFKSKKVIIKEAFLGFIEVQAKDAASLEDVIIESLNLTIASQSTVSHNTMIMRFDD